MQFYNPDCGGVGMMDMGMGGGMMVGMGGYGGFNYRPRNFRPFISMEDRHVMERHQEIYPCQEELDTILLLVDTVEKALKRVSDKIIGGEGSEERELMGVARVGDLAKGLLLKGDKEVHLVVMCVKKPSMEMLERITTALKKELTEADEQEDALKNIEVHMFAEEGGLCVTSSEVVSKSHFINV